MIVDARSLMTIGAKPSDGSSIMSSFGFAIMARAIATICCSPPLRLPALWLSLSLHRGNSSKTSSSFAFIAFLSLSRYAPILMLSATLI